jgi:outer membrane biosynthesis protein TonB
MTRHPPQPLDAEERALAALLPRPHGRTEPGADLDARILAAAQAALQAQPTVRRPRRSWIGPTALAASLVLAVGLAWQLRPPPALPAPAAAEDAASMDVVSMRAIESPPPSPMTQAKPMAVPAPQAIVSAPPAQDMPAGTSAPEAAVAAAPPPAPPAPPAPVMAAEAAAVATPQAAEPARAQAPVMAKATASEAMRERAAASGNLAAENREEAQRAADAATLDAVVVSESEEDVPPATADSPSVREAWLRRIGELLEQGKADEAKASLAEFRRRYPDATLPPELRKLEP